MADQAGGEGKKPLGRAVESLGWLASSGVQPKRRREIEGVGAASLVALQAQVAKHQQEAQLVKEGKLDAEELRARRKGSVAALLERKNAGVAARDQKDRAEIKTASDRLADSRAALEHKAALYDRLARGEEDDEGDKYEVDFLMKPRQQEELDTTGLAVASGTGGLISGDMARERERRSWEEDAHAEMAAEAAAERQRAERRERLKEVIDETATERERAVAARQQRTAAEAKKRERLKAAFLKRQAEVLLQQRTAAQQGASAGQQQQQQQSKDDG